MLMALLLLAACGPTPGATPPSPETDLAAATPEETITDLPGSPGRMPCEDGRLLISDLAYIDGQWQAGLARLDQLARAWHADSRLIEFRVSCAVFEPGFRWQATYYSAEAQALFSADTRESRPIDVDASEIASVDLQQVSFALIRAALLSIDFLDDHQLEPSTGLDIRVNSPGLPFGPATVPVGATVAHVAIPDRGVIKDIFIDVDRATIHRVQSPTG